MRHVFVVIPILSLSFFCKPVQAWNARGHKIIASIVFRQMNARQRSRFVEMLQQHPRFNLDFMENMPTEIEAADTSTRQEWLFQQAAIWPDMVRGGDSARRAYHRGRWHYINRPFFLRSDDERELEDLIDVNLNVEPPRRSSDDRNMNIVQSIANLARATDLRIQVKYEGKSRSLFNLVQPDAADSLVRTARETVSLTFSEMHSEDQHEAVLRQIRNNIWKMLAAFNEYLIDIEVEPIAACLDKSNV